MSTAADTTAETPHVIDTDSVLATLNIVADEAPEAPAGEASADAPTEAAPITTDDVTAAQEAAPDLFTDEALSTKEGMLAAKDAVRKLKIKNQQIHFKTVKREKEATEARRVADHNAQVYNNLSQHVQRELHTLTHGTTDEALAVLGRLRQADGNKVYEEMTNAILANGKKPKLERDPRVDELGQKLDQLQSFLVGQKEQASVERFNGAITTDLANATAYPSIGHFMKSGKISQDDVVQAVTESVMAAARAKQPIPHFRSLLRQYEANLKDLIPAAPVTPEKKALTNGRLPGKGAAPARANAATGSREMTEKERLDDAASDPSFLASLGIHLE